ncbi:MAG: zinc-ribbon and DUF3426 domain-containing protein [Gammaproteobacteria bacterium]|jgi:predicted Zn finger-like uncharacterized protein|nr:zinc-ribbon and DUF3426 domain-containing protein [Gammaproteobacteria bacterium]
MSSLTRCPRCSVWYRIGPKTLEAADGFVRCGRCGEIFDARTTLWSEASASSPPEAPEPVSVGSAATATPDGAILADPFAPESADEPHLGRLEDLDLEDASAPPLGAGPTEGEAFAAVEEPFTIPAPNPAGPGPFPSRAAPKRARRPGWLLANVFLALLLGASLIYLHPWKSRSTTPLTPADRAATAAARSHPKAFRITAAEVVPSRAHPRTGLVIAGTILNETGRPSALPWLLVRLTDLAGRTLVTGAFPPALYAPRAHGFLRARNAISFRLRVLAPPHAAAGFRLNLCRGRPPRLECR